jgi:hypothetical protein
VLAIRLSLEAGQTYQAGRAWWRCERRIRAAIGSRAAAHVPDAEISWPDITGSAYAGECWAIEAELTPKSLARTAGIMAALATRSSDELWDLAAAGAGRHHQALWALRQFRGAVPLRFAVLAPRRRKTSP